MGWINAKTPEGQDILGICKDYVSENIKYEIFLGVEKRLSTPIHPNISFD